jgi:hypothetical protein
MARCPFARWDEISGSVGSFSGGPFKIVHHTTEGSTYAGARAAYAAARSDPHFTVAGDDIIQHVDTEAAARSLRNRPGGVETNRDSAVQIEIVAHAGRPKDVATLQAVARLCRWIETEHGVPQRWPSGRPRFTTNGRDPGGHNRNAEIWEAEGGHYGHSQVPENTHWDPGYTPAELAIVTPEAAFDPHDELAAVAPQDIELEAAQPPAREEVEAIAQRVVAGLSAKAASTLTGKPSRVTVRVAAGGVEVEVTIEGARAGVRRSGAKRSGRRG